MEAGTGIEPVFTDLQSSPFSPEIKPVAGKKYQDKAGTPGEHDTPASKPKSALSRAIADRHKRASKALGLALFQGTDHAWRLTAEIWHLRLTPDERYPAAVAMLSTLTPDDMLEAVTAVLGGAGMPLPSFLEPLDEAQWWADLASPAELDAYLLAIFATLPKRKKRDFIEYAQGVTA